ncbi:hypothetical protein IFM53868_09558 [Aspergillus udagawae]|uniref:Uncharacterized protein n=1 Tax=Aspergillus udagawae TaxID=91492 RepID=A0ABQ1BBS7_9EURO|nr:hypothetical protein IFM53868_09558 [Aspergillus udagawae]
MDGGGNAAAAAAAVAAAWVGQPSVPTGDPDLGPEGVLGAWVHLDVQAQAFQVAVQGLPEDLEGAGLLLIQMDPQETRLVQAQEGDGPEEEVEELLLVPDILLLSPGLEPS